MEVLLICSVEQLNAGLVLLILSTILVTTAAMIACSKRWTKANTMQKILPLEIPVSEESRDVGSLVLDAGCTSISRTLHFPTTQSDATTVKPTEQVSTDEGKLVIS